MKLNIWDHEKEDQKKKDGEKERITLNVSILRDFDIHDIIK